jgi:hypothetical protein
MTHIQHAVNLVGDRGRYQKIMLAFFILVYLELGLMLLGSPFIFKNPEFECPGIDEPTEDQACEMLEQCTLGTDHPMQSTATRSRRTWA